MTTWHEWVQWLAAAALLILATARVTRFVTDDHYPPMEWIRNQYRKVTRYGGWSLLVDCPFCAAPYIVAVDLAWLVWQGPDDTWWLIINAWLAVSYLASMIVVRDEPPPVDEE